MTDEFKKILGIIVSFVWLGITGCISLIGFFFALEADDKSKWPEIQIPFVFFYIIGGIGPVSIFVTLMKRLDHPIGKVTLICIGIFGVLPVILFVISYLLS